VRLLAAPDKFRGTLDAPGAADAIERAASKAGWQVTCQPLSDGGEGFDDAFLGTMVALTVADPLGVPVTASYKLNHGTAIIEMAHAAGRALLPHPTGDDPLMASTRGVGQLIADAYAKGATRIFVGCGGSATTDGGFGVVEELEDLFPNDRCRLVAAVDVLTTFIDAAKVFAPQKGATPDQVKKLTWRLTALAETYDDLFGVDVRTIPGSGAAGGLAGGLAALGGEIRSGFDVVAREVRLDDQIALADLIVTGEGTLDATSFEGKTVGSLIERVAGAKPIVVIVGAIDPSAQPLVTDFDPTLVEFVSLTERFGAKKSLKKTGKSLRKVVEEVLAGR
jgi:glycerate 2-kinase